MQGTLPPARNPTWTWTAGAGLLEELSSLLDGISISSAVVADL